MLLSSLFIKSTSEIEKKSIIKKELPKGGILEIPNIGLKRNFYDSSNVDRNIIVVKKSQYPNLGNSMLALAAHSGTGKYAYFNYLYKLKIGDFANVYYNNKKYSYVLVCKYNIKKDGTALIYKYKNYKTLVLITCKNNVKGMQTVYIFKEL